MKVLIKFNSTQFTYRAPPPIGPNALVIDIAVIEMPLAAPLWCWGYHQQYSVKERPKPQIHSLVMEFMVENKICKEPLFEERSELTTALFNKINNPVTRDT